MSPLRITPDPLTLISPESVLVFGSNTAGRHSRGDAKLAKERFGAVEGVGFGFSGRSFAVPVRDWYMNLLTLPQINNYLEAFFHFAKWQRPELYYYVTKIGCGHSLYTPAEIAPLFVKAVELKNVFLPEEFWEVINKQS